MNRPKFLIFDCDGVLVDSEIIANRIEAEVKTALGFPTTTLEQIKKFVGMGSNNPVIRDEISRLPENYLETVDRLCKEAYANELKAIDGVQEVLGAIDLPKCVASSSELDWIKFKLSVTGLESYFPVLFSGHMVKLGKPAPDLFLFAAEQMGWSASNCLVIEDSVAGVRAARAAEMRVIGFIGGAHIFSGYKGALIEAGADHVVSDMRELLDFLKRPEDQWK